MDPTTQPIRSDAIYISYIARRGLQLAKVKMGETYPGPDGLADMVILEWLGQKHPEIMKHLEDREKQDKAFRDGLKPKIPLG